MSAGPPGVLGDAVDDLVDRALTAVFEAVRVRRALRRLRNGDGALNCAVSRPSDAGGPSRWSDGVARPEVGRLHFSPASGSGPGSVLVVTSVVDTRYVRRRDHGPGPRVQGVVRVRTPDGALYWAAHPRLLAEARAMLLDRPAR